VDGLRWPRCEDQNPGTLNIQRLSPPRRPLNAPQGVGECYSLARELLGFQPPSRGLPDATRSVGGVSLRSRNPHPTGVVMGTGYGSPGWGWPKVVSLLSMPTRGCGKVENRAMCGANPVSYHWSYRTITSTARVTPTHVGSPIDGAPRRPVREGLRWMPPCGGREQSRTLRVRILYNRTYVSSVAQFDNSPQFSRRVSIVRWKT
jgi:hypothetical protein